MVDESPLMENDLITSVNGQSIATSRGRLSLDDIYSLIEQTAPGKSLRLSIMRYNEFQVSSSM